MLQKKVQWLSVIEANMFIPEIELLSLLIDCSVAIHFFSFKFKIWWHFKKMSYSDDFCDSCHLY